MRFTGRPRLRSYLVEHLGDVGAVLVVDETGDLKQGVRTVGVQPSTPGTAGRIENAQVAVYLTYAIDAGHAFIDRAPYLPPHPVPLRILVRVAGKRWTVEDSFQTGKGLTGLDQHQVRGPRGTAGRSWRCSLTLSSLRSLSPNAPMNLRSRNGLR
jgi:SRSO17 transposase